MPNEEEELDYEEGKLSYEENGWPFIGKEEVTFEEKMELLDKRPTRKTVEKMLDAIQDYVDLPALCQDWGRREPMDIPWTVIHSHYKFFYGLLSGYYSAKASARKNYWWAALPEQREMLIDIRGVLVDPSQADEEACGRACPFRRKRRIAHPRKEKPTKPAVTVNLKEMLTIIQDDADLPALCQDYNVREPKDIPSPVIRSHYRFFKDFLTHSPSAQEDYWKEWSAEEGLMVSTRGVLYSASDPCPW